MPFLEPLFDILLAWDDAEELADDLRRRRRQKQVGTVLVGFLVAVGGAILIGRGLRDSPLVAVLAGLAFFLICMMVLVWTLRRRSTTGTKK